MTIAEIITAVVIHLIIPLSGLSAFLVLLKQMKTEQIDDPPIIELFALFVTYGGFLLITLTGLF